MDVNCAKFNGDVCVNCSKGFYPGINGRCTQFNPLCKESNRFNGDCTRCYPGYTLAAGDCVIGDSAAGNGDPNCKSTNAAGVCKDCYASYYLSSQNTCLRLDPLCKNYTARKDACDGCYDGYTLYQGKCVISTQIPDANSDPYCIATKGAICVKCANGYYLSHDDGLCKQLNPLCKKSNMSNGQCKDCYTGYTLSAGTCIVAASVNIPYCARVAGIACA